MRIVVVSAHSACADNPFGSYVAMVIHADLRPENSSSKGIVFRFDDRDDRTVGCYARQPA